MKKKELRPRHHPHLDRRVPQLLAAAEGEADDELLTTKELVEWLGIARITLEVWRMRKFGPPYIKLSPHIVRYRRRDVLAWLEERMHLRLEEASG